MTNAQYAAYLRAMAPTSLTDTHNIYYLPMGFDARGGITRTSTLSGDYTYSLKANMGNKPVNWVNYWDACLFCNWLHNGKPSGAQAATTTEDGAYTIPAIPGNTGIVHNAGAKFFLPSTDQSYKAAYYDPVSAGADFENPDYWYYPTMSDTAPTVGSASAIGDIINPGVNVANYFSGADWGDPVVQDGNVTTFGSATSTSFYGVFDMAGNASEWTETGQRADHPAPEPDQRKDSGAFG